jgi:hypothetical protein
MRPRFNICGLLLVVADVALRTVSILRRGGGMQDEVGAVAREEPIW